MGFFGDAASSLLGNAAGTVLLNYKANTDEAKIKLRELTGEQKKQAQQAITAAAQAKADVEKQISDLQKQIQTAQESLQ